MLTDESTKMTLPPDMKNLLGRPEGELNHDLLRALTTVEIEHVVDVYGRDMSNGAILWSVSALISLPWGILIGWWIWG